MNQLSLVVLAAGMGSRYGGLKQLDGVGPNGEVIMEYSIYDALRAGVDRVVFVIRDTFQDAFQETLLSRLPERVTSVLAFQEFADLPGDYATTLDLSKREKPWGTGHAVWAAREQINSPFMAINADDYYGPQAFARLAEHLRSKAQPGPCMVGFRLANTLSPSGTVSRGVCDVEEGALVSIQERTKLRRTGPQEITDEDSGATYSPSVLVSMNCWGFGADFMDFLEGEFSDYLSSVAKGEADLARGEFYLPAAVDSWRQKSGQKVAVETSEEPWLGVTYPEDKEAVVAGLRQHIQNGVYPENLWA